MEHEHEAREPRTKRHEHSTHNQHYRHLSVMLALSFVAMYGLMYAMVDGRGDVFMNLNQVYMAALMTAPMAVIELLVMRGMYTDRRSNLIAVTIAAVVLGVSWTGIRRQAAISDAQFIRSMIPHHSGAILMCEEASLRDPALQELCTNIIAGQRAEIDQMKRLLENAR